MYAQDNDLTQRKNNKHGHFTIDSNGRVVYASDENTGEAEKAKQIREQRLKRADPYGLSELLASRQMGFNDKNFGGVGEKNDGTEEKPASPTATTTSTDVSLSQPPPLIPSQGIRENVDASLEKSNDKQEEEEEREEDTATAPADQSPPSSSSTDIFVFVDKKGVFLGATDPSGNNVKFTLVPSTTFQIASKTVSSSLFNIECGLGFYNDVKPVSHYHRYCRKGCKKRHDHHRGVPVEPALVSDAPCDERTIVVSKKTKCLRVKECSSESEGEEDEYCNFHHGVDHHHYHRRCASESNSSTSSNSGEDCTTERESLYYEGCGQAYVHSNPVFCGDNYEQKLEEGEITPKQCIENHINDFKSSFRSDKFSVENYYDDSISGDDESYDLEYEIDESGNVSNKAFVTCNACSSPLTDKEDAVSCGNCGIANYCDEKCQANDWKDGSHKHHCEKLKEASEIDHRFVSERFNAPSNENESENDDDWDPRSVEKAVMEFDYKRRDLEKPIYLTISSFVASGTTSNRKIAMENTIQSMIDFKLPYKISKRKKKESNGSADEDRDPNASSPKKKRGIFKKIKSKGKRIVSFARHPKNSIKNAKSKAVIYKQQHGANLKDKYAYLKSMQTDSPEVQRQKQKLKLAQEEQNRKRLEDYKQRREQSKAEIDAKKAEYSAKKASDDAERNNEKARKYAQKAEKYKMRHQSTPANPSKSPNEEKGEGEEGEEEDERKTANDSIADVELEPTAQQLRIMTKLGIDRYLVGDYYVHGRRRGHGGCLVCGLPATYRCSTCGGWHYCGIAHQTQYFADYGYYCPNGLRLRLGGLSLGVGNKNIEMPHRGGGSFSPRGSFRGSANARTGFTPRVYAGNLHRNNSQPLIVRGSGSVRPLVRIGRNKGGADFRMTVPRRVAVRSRTLNDISGRKWYKRLPYGRQRWIRHIYNRYRHGNYLRLWDLPYYNTYPVLPIIQDSYWDDSDPTIDRMMEEFRIRYAYMYQQGYEIIPDYQQRRFVWTTANPDLLRPWVGPNASNLPPPPLYV